MEIHNLMEDMVTQTVDELFDAGSKGEADGWCTCRQCRLDVACYALNRLKPEYVLSGRGVAYADLDYNEKLQRTADVVTYVREGWRRINASPRPNHAVFASGDCTALPPGPVYNFRPIVGRLFNGSSFEPIVDARVSLLDENGLVRMMDTTWFNPYDLVRNTNGTFTFWPFPVQCAARGERNTFGFTVNIIAPGYEEVNHYLELALVSDPSADCHLSMLGAHHLQDIYLFPQ